MKNYLALCLIVASFQSHAGYDPKDPKGYPRPGSISVDPRISAKAEAIAESSAQGVGIGGNAQGGQGVGSVNVTGNGNNVYRQVRQAPFAYSPGLVGSYSQFNCANSVSVGVSTPFGAAGVGVSDESDDCNRRSDSVRWQELGMAPTACQRMLIESEENQEAMKASGLNCNELKGVAVAAPVPPAVANHVETPALDDYDRKKRDQLFEEKMLK